MEYTVWTMRNFPKDLYKDAKIRAVQEEITLKELVIRALKAYLGKE
jgi:hypothetical protein